MATHNYQKFFEEDSDFYDLEYFLGQELRYLSGAHGSRVRNLLKTTGNVKGKRILDVGCGDGYLTHKLKELGAEVVGIDYSYPAIRFSSQRYPDTTFKKKEYL